MLGPILVLGLLSAFDVVLALSLVPFLAAVVLIPILMRTRIDRLAGNARELLGALSSHTVESVQGLGELLAYQATVRRKKEFVALIKKHHAERLPFFREMTFQTVITDLLTVCAGLAIILTSVPLVTRGEFDAVYIPLLALAAMAAFLPVIEISNAGRQLAETFAATSRLIQVHETLPSVTDGESEQTDSANPLSAIDALDIEFCDVGFRYSDQDALAVKDFNLNIPAGATIAIVGESGARKSTVSHLLLRFWDPQHGEIRVGGYDIRNLKLEDLRQQVALVAQDTYLFNDSLRENLLMAKPDATEAEIMTAVASCGTR